MSEPNPAPIFELFRGNYATELLTAAVSHFQLFDLLATKGPLSPDELGRELSLAERPLVVLTTALKAMNLLATDAQARFTLTELSGRYLTSSSPLDVSGYIGLAAQSPGVLEMVRRLRSNKPANAESPETGAAFIYRDDLASAMESETSARNLTMALAGRAKNVAPALANAVDLSKSRHVLDVGGGSGLYAIEFLRTYPTLRATIWDRPEVLKVASEFAAAAGLEDRLVCRPGDMFADPVPGPADVVLLSNILHDWDIPECRLLINRLADALPAGGTMLIHDVLLNDSMDGPLEIALYSAALFSLTQGRAYCAAEYPRWMRQAGLQPRPPIPTRVHCSVIAAEKPAT